jgi:hypothetical protein
VCVRGCAGLWLNAGWLLVATYTLMGGKSYRKETVGVTGYLDDGLLSFTNVSGWGLRSLDEALVSTAQEGFSAPTARYCINKIFHKEALRVVCSVDDIH